MKNTKKAECKEGDEPKFEEVDEDTKYEETKRRRRKRRR